jgi:hypothetical protein
MATEARYLHVVKVTGERDRYDLAFHTRFGIEPGGIFTGADVDRIRSHERKLRGKKLTIPLWKEFFKKEKIVCVPSRTPAKSSMSSVKSAAKSPRSQSKKKRSKRK